MICNYCGAEIGVIIMDNGNYAVRHDCPSRRDRNLLWYESKDPSAITKKIHETMLKWNRVEKRSCLIDWDEMDGFRRYLIFKGRSYPRGGFIYHKSMRKS